MTVHILDMASPRLESLCRADTPFMISPGLHAFDRRGVDCVVCLDLDDVIRRANMDRHPSVRGRVDP